MRTVYDDTNNLTNKHSVNEGLETLLIRQGNKDGKNKNTNGVSNTVQENLQLQHQLKD